MIPAPSSCKLLLTLPIYWTAPEFGVEERQEKNKRKDKTWPLILFVDRPEKKVWRSNYDSQFDFTLHVHRRMYGWLTL